MPIKIGIVDFDSSHCVEFTKRINHVGMPEDQWVDGGRVVLGCPGTSLLSPERVPGYTDEMKQLGVTLVDKPTDMIGKVDAVMILSVDGGVHLERTRPFLEAGLPCFVDKPFTCSLDEAKRLVELAGRKRVPIFSASALRYAPEVVQFIAEASAESSLTGPVLGASVYGPSPTHARNPGLFHYGIHATEMLFTLMGRDCESVTCSREGGDAGSERTGVEAVTGRWSGGRIGTVRGIRSGASAYGFVAFCERAVQHVSVGTEYVYRELLKQVVRMFETGKSPLATEETLAVVAFIEAARKSGNASGCRTSSMR